MNLEAAKRAARKALERTYEGRATVEEYRRVTDPTTHITSNRLVVVLENEPCKLSYETLKEAASTGSVATISQGVKLFLSPDTEIKPGSKITVTQSGRTVEYACSGQPAVYDTHQEIILCLYDDYA